VSTARTLSEHQLDTLRLYQQLGTYAGVADFRGVQVQTVGNTLRRIREKLGVATTAEAIAWLRDQGAAS
jgi:DNA-binding CsgD family transcriptional regulator